VPSASPVAPNDVEIESDIGVGNPFLRLADVLVANGVTEIANISITDKRDAIQLLQPFHGVSARMTTHHDVPTGVDSMIFWDTTFFDTDGFWEDGTANELRVNDPKLTGIYHVHFSWRAVNDVTTGGTVEIQIVFNGTVISQDSTRAGADFRPALNASALINMSINDKLVAKVRQHSGATIQSYSTVTRFNMFKA